jgi:hypothetical protein
MLNRSLISKGSELGRWCLAVAAAFGMSSFQLAEAQGEGPAPLPHAVAMPYAEVIPTAPAKDAPLSGAGIIQAGCRTCGSPLHSESFSDMGCDSCGGNCVPGHFGCAPCTADSCIGRFFCGIHDCLCCPDPCYEPRWIAAADSAFFVDGARPANQTRLRWDSGLNMQFPDRAEYFWARADGNGKGPRFPIHGFRGETSLDYNDISMYTEIASGNFSASVDVPYRSIDPQQANHAAGFGDITIGTKSMLFDCELMQVTFGFKTTLPSGNFTKGIGNGLVSLEPSLLVAIRLAQNTYWQSQVSEWIPLGGDNDYSGAILHYHFSLNHVLWKPIEDVQLIGTAEFNGWSFQDGAYTDPVAGAFQKASGDTYISIGPGLRLVICDKVDFGVGAAFSVTNHHFADQLYRTEFRWRF